jgi:hypothetical protein
MSADGRYVVYESNATNLAAGVTDTNGVSDVFLLDRTTGTTTLVSHQSSNGVVAANDKSVSPFISGDGRYVAYTSSASNLVDGQTAVPPAHTNLFVYDRLTGITALATHSPVSDHAGAGGEESSILVSMSGDGKFLAFATASPDVVQGDYSGYLDVFGYSSSAPVKPVSVQSVLVSDASPQRSMVTSTTVVFSTLVTLPANPVSAFRLTRTGPGGPVGDVTLAVDLSGSTALQTVARLTFSGPLTQFGSLIDGNYTLTVFGSQVSGPGGVLLDGDADGTPGGDSVSALFRLFGDVNGDRAVNGLDMIAFRTAFGTSRRDANYNVALDFDGDGVINGTDLTAFRSHFGMILP